MTKRAGNGLSFFDDDIIRGGLGFVTDKTTKKKKNRRQSKKPLSHIWLRGLKKPKAEQETA